MLKEEEILRLEKLVSDLESNLLIFSYGDLAFNIAIISKFEKIDENISLKDFYKLLIDNKSRTISIKVIGAENESSNNADIGKPNASSIEGAD